MAKKSAISKARQAVALFELFNQFGAKKNRHWSAFQIAIEKLGYKIVVSGRTPLPGKVGNEYITRYSLVEVIKG